MFKIEYRPSQKDRVFCLLYKKNVMGNKIYRAFKGVWIDKSIWLDKNLSLTEKVFLVEIDSLDNDEGCFASNSYFAEFFDLTAGRCSQIISNLQKKGYINVIFTYKKFSPKEIEKRILKVANKFNFPPFNKLNTPLENADTPLENADTPLENADTPLENADTPLENAQDNNTFNNTINNSVEATPNFENQKPQNEIKNLTQSLDNYCVKIGLNPNQELAWKIKRTINSKQNPQGFLDYLNNYRSNQDDFDDKKLKFIFYQDYWYNDFLAWEVENKEYLEKTKEYKEKTEEEQMEDSKKHLQKILNNPLFKQNLNNNL